MKNRTFHVHELKTRWKDLDVFGHINNALFLSYIEDARISFLQTVNITKNTNSIILASITIDYLKQINHPEKLIVKQFISKLGKTSFEIHADILSLNKKIHYASSKAICVCFNYKTNTKLPLYKEIKENYLQD